MPEPQSARRSPIRSGFASARPTRLEFLRDLQGRHADRHDLARHVGRRLRAVLPGRPGSSCFWPASIRPAEPLAHDQVLRQHQLAPPDGLALAHSLRGGGYWQIVTLFWAGLDALLGRPLLRAPGPPQLASVLALRVALGDFPDRVHLGVPPAARRLVGRRAGARPQRRSAVGAELQRAVGQPLLQPLAPARDLLPVRKHDALGHARRDDPRDEQRRQPSRRRRDQEHDLGLAEGDAVLALDDGLQRRSQDDSRLAVVVRGRRRARVGHRHPLDRRRDQRLVRRGASITARSRSTVR